ncbi:unknown [Firmicutes bacterium CAG:137]|nr:unknown [Firmicutes bacterium CAG:137]
MGLGRKGERVAKTPIRRFPPSLGGRTVGDHPPCRLPEKFQISQI